MSAATRRFVSFALIRVIRDPEIPPAPFGKGGINLRISVKSVDKKGSSWIPACAGMTDGNLCASAVQDKSACICISPRLIRFFVFPRALRGLKLLLRPLLLGAACCAPTNTLEKNRCGICVHPWLIIRSKSKLSSPEKNRPLRVIRVIRDSEICGNR
jgi:hypothetical protein